MIFSSAIFLIFWSLTLFVSKKFNLNSPIFIGIVGIIFYCFQGLINSLVFFLIFLFCISYLKIRKFFFLFLIILIIPLFLFKYSKIFQFLNIDIPIYLLDEVQLYYQTIPPGLSFLTFSAIALIIAIKKNSELKIDKSNIFAYLYFFPHLIAGPIVRPNQLIPQINSFQKIILENIYFGFFLFSVGITLKVLIADNISNYIDPILGNIKNQNFESIIISILLFSQQIFYDFSGYTLMAIGVAKSLSINLPENFNSPYTATSISDFWKKWHITLSSWIRDYIYIPLGGSRVSKTKHFINILLAMIISGIWHGYGFTFLIWGLLHGIIIILEKIIKFKNINYFLKVGYTYILVTLLWSLFRINDLNDWNIIIFEKVNFDFSLNFLIILIFFYLINFLQKYLVLENLKSFFLKTEKSVTLTISAILTIFCIILSSGSSKKFIYFNF